MKAVVCGAGIAGLSLAHELATRGDEVVLLERSPRPREQGYMMDFFGPGYDAAEQMGVLPAILDVSYDIDEASFVDSHGRSRARLPYERFRRAVGGRLCSLMRPDLEQVLREALPSSVDLRFGAEVTACTDRGPDVEVCTADGAVLAADVLIGADGIHSGVRRLAFGDDSNALRYLGFHTAAFVFDDARIREACAGRFALTDTIGRQMGFYALRDGRVAAFGVHRTPDPGLPDDTRTAVREAYRSLEWVVPEALAQCPPSEEIYYDQVAQVVMPAWSAGRIALVGDACHAVSLLAGQGASLAVAGARALAAQLHSGAPMVQALAAYERQWRPVAEDRQASGRATARWFLPRTHAELWVRRAALRMAGLPLVNRALGAFLSGS